MNRQKKEELEQARQQQGDHSKGAQQQHGQKPMPGQQSQQPASGYQQSPQGGKQQFFRPTDTD